MTLIRLNRRVLKVYILFKFYDQQQDIKMRNPTDFNDERKIST